MANAATEQDRAALIRKTYAEYANPETGVIDVPDEFDRAVTERMMRYGDVEGVQNFQAMRRGNTLNERTIQQMDLANKQGQRVQDKDALDFVGQMASSFHSQVESIQDPEERQSFIQKYYPPLYDMMANKGPYGDYMSPEYDHEKAGLISSAWRKEKTGGVRKVIATPQMYDADVAPGNKAGWYYPDETGKPVQFIRKIIKSDLMGKNASGLGENELIKVTSKEMPKLKTDATKQARNVQTIDRALQLVSSGGVTGKSGQLKAVLGPWAETVGWNTQGMDDAQTFQKLTRVITGPMRLDLIGAGPVSEYEQKLMQEMSGGGGTGQAAAVELLNYYKKIAADKVQIYNDTLEGYVQDVPGAAKYYRPITIGGSARNAAPAQPGGAQVQIAPAGTRARLENGRVITSDGKGGWR